MIMRRIRQWIRQNSNDVIALLPIILSGVGSILKMIVLWMDRSENTQGAFLKWLNGKYLDICVVDTLQIILIFCTFWVLIRIHGWILVNEKEKIWLKSYLRRWSTKTDKSDDSINFTTDVVSGTCNQFYILWLVIWMLFFFYYAEDLFFRIMFKWIPVAEVLDYVQIKDFFGNILNFASSAAMYSMYIILNNVTFRRRLRSDIDKHNLERGIISLGILFFIIIIVCSYGMILDVSLYGKYQFIVSLCLSGFSTLSFILLLGKLNSNHLMIPNRLLYGLYLYAIIQIFGPFMGLFVNISGNEGIIRLYVEPNSIYNDYLLSTYQYLTFLGKMVLTFTIIWMAKEYRLMYFVLYKSLSLEQSPSRMSFFRQFMNSSV